MNREIEFRAWLKDEKKMVEVKEIIFVPEKQIAYDAEYRNGKSLPFHYLNYKLFNDIELIEYTGLKDKNGVKIFEGDIIRIYGGEKMFGYYEFDRVKVIKELEDLVMLSNLNYEVEVIGNIYENPESLEVQYESETD